MLEAWQRDIPAASRWPIHLDDPVLIRKYVVQAVFSNNMWSSKADIEWAFAPESLADFIRAGQYLGAEGLRYAYDALRRKGKRIGGMTNHCYSEPWPNGAGSAIVDFDGRTYLNYDFFKQAIAPNYPTVSSLRTPPSEYPGVSKSIAQLEALLDLVGEDHDFPGFHAGADYGNFASRRQHGRIHAISGRFSRLSDAGVRA